MIKAEDGTVEINGKGKQIMEDFFVICVSLFKNGIPFEILTERMVLANAFVRNKETEDSMLEGIQKTFKNMSDKNKAELINALREVVDNDD